MAEFLTPHPDETYQGSLSKNVSIKGWQTATLEDYAVEVQ